MATDFMQKMENSPYSSLWHSETVWDIAMLLLFCGCCRRRCRMMRVYVEHVRSVAVEGKAILSRYIAEKQSGSEVAVRKGHYATSFPYQARTRCFLHCNALSRQEGLAVASIARDDPSTLPGDDPFPRARMHRDRSAR